ncbi:glucosamine-6-phosphate deaminase [Kwoniella sp. CBS 6097]
MYLQIHQTSEEASQAVADLIIHRIRAFSPTQYRKFVLGLPTGGTPVRAYEILAERCEAGDISFEHVISINLDEYVGLPPTHEQSYVQFMEKHFDIPPSQTHILPGIPITPTPNAMAIPSSSGGQDNNSPLEAHQASCAAYEALITSLGGINLLFMGIGANGHIGFNEPGSSFASRTRVVALNEGTRDANSRFFDDKSKVPTHALSMGLGTILDAEEIVVLAMGSNKGDAIQRAVEEGINHMCPASVLQQHARVTIVADGLASSKLKEETKDYLGSSQSLYSGAGLLNDSTHHQNRIKANLANGTTLAHVSHDNDFVVVVEDRSADENAGERGKPVITLLAKGDIQYESSEDGDDPHCLPGL